MIKILLILFVALTYTFANVGKITAVKGEVYIVRDSKQITAISGSILQLKDKVQTKDKSKALVLFKDNTSITVGNNSLLSVNEFVMDLKTPSNSKTNFGFGKGVFRTITGRIGKINPKGFKIKTKSASIGIRGTIFKVSITPKNLVLDVQSGATWILPINQKIPTDVPEGKVLVFDDEKGTLEIMPKAEFEKKKAEENNEEENKEEENKEEENNEEVNKEEENNEEVNKEEENNEPTVSAPNEDPETTPEQGNTPPDEFTEIDPTELVDGLGDTVDDVEENNDNAVTPTVTQEETTSETDVGKVISNITFQSMCPNGTATESCEHFDNVDYGYLFEDQVLAGVYVEEKINTATSVIDTYINSGEYSAYYEGTVAALINGTTTSNGYIELDMNFGAKTFTGGIYVDTGNWNASISGTLDNASFTATDGGGYNDRGSITDGTLVGKYYGTSGESVAGIFGLTDGTDTVVGSFGAHNYQGGEMQAP